MSKTTFEKIGIPYEERDGIFYPVIVAGTEKADIDAGKYGRMWIKYIKEEYPMRYKSLVRFGELEERANEVNETAYELLDDIEAKWLKKHKPENPDSFMEQLQLRTHTPILSCIYICLLCSCNNNRIKDSIPFFIWNTNLFKCCFTHNDYRLSHHSAEYQGRISNEI